MLLSCASNDTIVDAMDAGLDAGAMDLAVLDLTVQDSDLDQSMLDAQVVDATSDDSSVGADDGVMGRPTSAYAGFTEIFLVRDTTTAADLLTYVQERPGLRFLGIKIPWSRLVAPETSSTISDPDGMIDALLTHIEANAVDLRVKLMIQAGPLVPDVIYSGESHLVRKLHKLNVSGSGVGATTEEVEFPLPWDPNLAWHFDSFAAALGVWLGETFDGVNARSSLIYAVQSSMPMTDVNTEMPDSYEGSSVLSVADSEVGELASAIAAGTTAIATDIAGCVGPAATSGLLLLEEGACGSSAYSPELRESVYFTSVTCDAGNYVFNVASSADTEASGITGRGWNAGSNVSGAASGIARSFAIGDCVHVRDMTSSDITSSTTTMHWLGTGDAVDDPVVRGYYEIPTLNQNLWSRTYNLTHAWPWHSYVRSGLAVTMVDDGLAETGSTEISRGRLVARAWMNSINILLTRLPNEVRVWQHGGNMWRYGGSPIAGSFAANSPNDAVRDFVRTLAAAPRSRMIWGYTVAYNTLTDPSDPSAGLGDWRAQSCMELGDAGVLLGIQTEAASNVANSLGHPERAIDYLFAAERLMTVFGTRLRWIESNADRSAVAGNRGQGAHYAVHDVALDDYTGVPGILTTQPGSMLDTAGTPIQTFHDMLVGKPFGIPSPGTTPATADPVWNTQSIDHRLRLLAAGGAS